jgi:hypothetical protein
VYRLVWKQRVARRSGRLAVAFRHPDRLRLEILEPLGGPRWVLVAAGGRALLLEPAGRAYLGFASGREAVETMTGFPIDPRLAPALLLGIRPDPPGMRCEPVSPAPRAERVCREEGGGVILREEPATGRLSLHTAGGAGFRSRPKPSSPDTRTPPAGLRIEQVPKGAEIRLELLDLSYVAPEPGDFDLSPPRGFRPDPHLAERIRPGGAP